MATRIELPTEKLSIDCGAAWSVQELPPNSVTLHPGLGAYLVHNPTGIQLNVRRLYSLNFELQSFFEQYAEIAWPGSRRSMSRWTEANLTGISGVFPEAMPGVVVREWLATDGVSLANIAGFAPSAVWNLVLDECEKLVRSLRFWPTHGADESS